MGIKALHIEEIQPLYHSEHLQKVDGITLIQEYWGLKMSYSTAFFVRISGDIIILEESFYFLPIEMWIYKCQIYKQISTCQYKAIKELIKI